MRVDFKINFQTVTLHVDRIEHDHNELTKAVVIRLAKAQNDLNKIKDFFLPHQLNLKTETITVGRNAFLANLLEISA